MSRRNYFTIVSVFALVGLSMFAFLRSLNTAKAQPVKAQPAKAQPAKAQPAKAQPVKAQPAKAQPVKPVKARAVVRESPRKIVKSPEEWKKTLTPEQYKILREAGTEAPYGKAYHEFMDQG